jgi:hypothetical protein
MVTDPEERLAVSPPNTSAGGNVASTGFAARRRPCRLVSKITQAVRSEVGTMLHRDGCCPFGEGVLMVLAIGPLTVTGSVWGGLVVTVPDPRRVLYLTGNGQ